MRLPRGRSCELAGSYTFYDQPTRSPSMPSATISGLYRYPIKGCRGTALDRVTLSRTGFEHDRRWLVVTPDGQGLTQRQIPRLALVAPRVDGELLVLEAPQMPALEVSPRSDGEIGRASCRERVST